MVTLSKMSHHLIAVHQCGPDRSTEDTPTISYAVQWRSPCPRRPASSSLPTSVVPGVMQWQSPCPRRPVSSSLPTSVVATGPQKTRRSPCPRRPCPARQLIPAHQCGSRCDAVAVTVSKTSSQLIPVHQCGSNRFTEDTAVTVSKTSRQLILAHQCGSYRSTEDTAVTVSKSSSHLIPVHRKVREARPPSAAAWCTETPRTACLRHRPAPR